jgi:hypothetical protein
MCVQFSHLRLSAIEHTASDGGRRHRRYLAGMGPLPENALGGRYPLHNAAYVLQ